MKKILLFAFLLFLVLPNIAQVTSVRPQHQGSPQGNTSLTVAVPRNQNYRFWLYVDDVLQNESPIRSICIRSLWNDNFHVRVELDNPQRNCAGQYVDMRQSQTLAVAHADKWYGLEPTDAFIHPEVTMDLITQQPNGGSIQPNLSPMPPLSWGMKPQDYEEACRLISNESFDSSKLTTAKQVVSSNPMTTIQILSICKLFSFESNKLEFAKFAYSYCVDQNKYYLLNEAFSYESSKRELNEYIKGF